MSADDRRLIAESLQGNSAAYGDLVRRYQDRLYNTVYRLVDNAEDAQDVVQEAFLNAYQALGRFKGDAQFFTWLYRIAMNAAISHRRKHRVTVRLDCGRAEQGHFAEPSDGSDFGQPGHALERTEQGRRVQDALNRLSVEHKTVLVLKDIEDLKYEAIAKILGLPVGTVRSRLHRARIELRTVLEQWGLET